MSIGVDIKVRAKVFNLFKKGYKFLTIIDKTSVLLMQKFMRISDFPNSSVGPEAVIGKECSFTYKLSYRT